MIRSRSLAIAICCITIVFGQLRSQCQQKDKPAAKPLSTADVLARVRPAVVTIIAVDANGKEIGQGSGFVVQPDGQVITAWHVVVGAKGVKVKLLNGKTFDVSGAYWVDADRDFALLKIDTTGLPFVAAGKSVTVRQGDRVLVLGSPLGLEQTASDGMVSAVRVVPGRGQMLQITAPLSPGNSGR